MNSEHKRSTKPIQKPEQLLCCPFKQCQELNFFESHILCVSCNKKFPILFGIPILVRDLESYFFEFAHEIFFLDERGQKNSTKNPSLNFNTLELIKPFVSKSFFSEFKDHLEENINEIYLNFKESLRVQHLYLLNHYESYELKKSLLQQNFNFFEKNFEKILQNPLDTTAFWIHKKVKSSATILDLGCSVGGMLSRIAAGIKSKTKSIYLGIDYSFLALYLARSLFLSQTIEIRIFKDFLSDAQIFTANNPPLDDKICWLFVIADIAALPVIEGSANIILAMNIIDMLEVPENFAKTTAALLQTGSQSFPSLTLVSDPYAFPSSIAMRLKKKIRTDPKATENSMDFILSLYQNAGFKIIENAPHHPWVFYKHARQIELYSTHLFMGLKKSTTS